MKAYNRGGKVTRDEKEKDVEEDVPPFAFVIIGRSGEQAASRERDLATVWEVEKPGRAAPLHRPETIAVNGPSPIRFEGWGQVTQDWPARVAIASENLPMVHGSVGLADDSWLAVPAGGLFTVLGADPIFLRENGATKDSDGVWQNLPETVLLWITPRGESRPWGQGWALTNTLPTVESLDFLLEQPFQYRLQQPYLGEPLDAPKDGEPEPEPRLFEPADHVTLWEPVQEEDDHDPEEEEEEYPIKRSIEWVKVRERGSYLIQFGAMISKADYTIIDRPEYIGIGLFGAAWNEETEEFEIYDQPVAIASRWPFRASLDLDATFSVANGAGYDYVTYTLDTLILRSQENVCASAVVELEGGWALGFLKIGLTEVLAEHFHWTGYKLGPASDPETFWAANAGKVDWDGSDHSPVDL